MSARLNGKPKSEEIKRKPTKAENTSMKLLGGGDDRRLNFIRTYTKDQKEIIVNLGHVKVDL